MTPPVGGRMPEGVELCPRCRRHVLHERWCFTCGYRGEGVVYRRRDPIVVRMCGCGVITGGAVAHSEACEMYERKETTGA
jgi:hypothetical protein